MSSAHPGFKAVAASIAAKEGVSQGAASAILAKRTRLASAKAVAKNPRLKRVKRKKKRDNPNDSPAMERRERARGIPT